MATARCAGRPPDLAPVGVARKRVRAIVSQQQAGHIRRTVRRAENVDSPVADRRLQLKAREIALVRGLARDGLLQRIAQGLAAENDRGVFRCSRRHVDRSDGAVRLHRVHELEENAGVDALRDSVGHDETHRADFKHDVLRQRLQTELQLRRGDGSLSLSAAIAIVACCGSTELAARALLSVSGAPASPGPGKTATRAQTARESVAVRNDMAINPPKPSN